MEAKALRFYERRLEGSRRWSGKYYEKNKSDINLRRILDGISHGRVPTKSSVEKYDRAVIAEAWLKHAGAHRSREAVPRFYLVRLKGLKEIVSGSC